MSFAPKKNVRNLNSSLERRGQTSQILVQSKTFLSRNSQNRSIVSDTAESRLARLEKIETSLGRICGQNEVLMPLLDMTSYLPTFTRTSADIKEIQKRLSENDKTLSYFEDGLEKYKEYFEDSKYRLEVMSDEKVIDNQQLEKQIKITNNHLNALHSNLKDVENTVVNLQTLLDKKFHEETKSIKETVESKLRKSKRDIQTAIKDSEGRIKEIFKENEENLKKFNIYQVEFSFFA